MAEWDGATYSEPPILRFDRDIQIMSYFLFGSATSFLSVIQETIIVTYIGRESLGIWIAAGLLLGRLAAWLGSVTALPLSETSYGLSAPFSVAVVVCRPCYQLAIADLADSWPQYPS